MWHLRVAYWLAALNAAAVVRQAGAAALGHARSSSSRSSLTATDAPEAKDAPLPSSAGADSVVGHEDALEDMHEARWGGLEVSAAPLSGASASLVELMSHVASASGVESSESLGAGGGTRRRRRRFALVAAYTSDFNGTNGDDILDMTQGRLAGPTSIEFIGRWDEFRPWTCILDFGRAADSDNIKVCNTNQMGELGFYILDGQVEKGFRIVNAFKLNEPRSYLMTVNRFGLMKAWINGVQVKALEAGQPPAKVFRTNFYVGRSSVDTAPMFKGRIQDLYIWNQEAQWGQRDSAELR